MTPVERLHLERAVLFFDLAGTLCETDTSLSAAHQNILLRIGHIAHRLVLVTGQASNDRQVRQLLDLFQPVPEIDFVAYTTRGGLRLARAGPNFEPDREFLAAVRLDERICDRIGSAVDALLLACRFEPFIPVACIDQVAMRINLPIQERLHFADILPNHLLNAGLSNLQVVIEGRTSIFVMRTGVGKRYAVAYELDLMSKAARSSPKTAHYFGNEFHPGGNDREVFGLPVEIHAIGGCEDVPREMRCHSIGASPDALYDALERALASR